MAGMLAFFIIAVFNQPISVPRVCSSLIYCEYLYIRHEQVLDKNGNKRNGKKTISEAPRVEVCKSLKRNDEENK